jgi:hypothetical protein
MEVGRSIGGQAAGLTRSCDVVVDQRCCGQGECDG